MTRSFSPNDRQEPGEAADESAPVGTNLEAISDWISCVREGAACSLDDAHLRELLRLLDAGEITREDAERQGLAWLYEQQEREKRANERLERIRDIRARMFPNGRSDM